MMQSEHWDVLRGKRKRPSRKKPLSDKTPHSGRANKLGVRGVWFCARAKRYIVAATMDGHTYQLRRGDLRSAVSTYNDLLARHQPEMLLELGNDEPWLLAEDLRRINNESV
jgi:hypothetical protein